MILGGADGGHRKRHTWRRASVENIFLKPKMSSMLPQNRRPAPLHRAATDPTTDWNESDCQRRQTQHAHVNYGRAAGTALQSLLVGNDVAPMCRCPPADRHDTLASPMHRNNKQPINQPAGKPMMPRTVLEYDSTKGIPWCRKVDFILA